MTESRIMAEMLRNNLDRKTPKTDEFEEAIDVNGRRYAQEKKRWWDKSTGRQLEHLMCWYSRKYYNGSTKECMTACKCENCYFKNVSNPPEDIKEVREANKVYNRMGRPEMYICIAEVLELLEEDKLEQLIGEVKEAMNKNRRRWKYIFKEYFTWEDVEKKLNGDVCFQKR